MENLKIVTSDCISFDEYKSWFEKYKNNNDVSEIKFQNEIVKKLICAICNNLDVEDTARKGPESKNHDYLQYCGVYEDNNGDKKAATPDLVIAKNWNWLNRKNVVNYRAVVEVKSPYQDPIYHKNYINYSNNLKNELKRHLSAKNNDKVILTDTMKWEFYEKCKGLVPIQTYRLYDLIGKKGKWKWKESKKCITKDDVTEELFGESLEYDSPVEEYEKLKKFLIKFLGEGD